MRVTRLRYGGVVDVGEHESGKYQGSGEAIC